MTAAPHSPLLDRVALAIRNAAEHPSDIRSGTLWFLTAKHKEPLEESDYCWLADNALDACHAEEMRRDLTQSAIELEEAANVMIVCGLRGTASLLSDAAARNRVLLAKLDVVS